MNKTNHSVSLLFVSGRLAWLTAALVVLFASTTVLASDPQGTFEKSLQVNGPVDLEVLTHSGDVTVRAGSSGSVFIRGKIFVGDRWFGGRREEDVHAIEQNPPLRQSGNSIHIDYVNYRNISVDYEITVPADTTIRSRSGSGDQIIEGTHGNVDVQTGSGDVKLSRLNGEIRLQTGSGNIRAHDVSGSVKGGTGSGDREMSTCTPGRAISAHAASRAASMAKRGAETLLLRARRPAPGICAPVPETCISSCRRMPPLTPISRPVRGRWMLGSRSK